VKRRKQTRQNNIRRKTRSSNLNREGGKKSARKKRNGSKKGLEERQRKSFTSPCKRGGTSQGRGRTGEKEKKRKIKERKEKGPRRGKSLREDLHGSKKRKGTGELLRHRKES